MSGDGQAIQRGQWPRIDNGTEIFDRVLEETLDENRRLRDACQQMNEGISRLRRRCDSQARKNTELKAALVESWGKVGP